MKVHVAIVGINRSLRFTWPSIEKQVLTPLRSRRGLSITVSLTLIDPPNGTVVNDRSSEQGSLDDFVPDTLQDQDLLLIDQGALDRDIEKKFSDFEGFNDPWSDDKSSLRNLARFLSALSTTYEASIKANNPDVVIFLRPDVLLLDRLYIGNRVSALKIIDRFTRGAAILPTWGRQRGLNDRFAVLSGRAVSAYFQRIELLSKRFFDGKSPNSEKLLKEALRGIKVSNSVYARMPRVRIGGVIAYRDKPMAEGSNLGFRSSIYSARIKRLARLVLSATNISTKSLKGRASQSKGGGAE